MSDSLLDAAFEEFGRRGYDAASLDRILSAGDASLHAVFDAKADLAVAVIEREGARHLAVLEPRMPNSIEEFWLELRRIRTVMRELERGGLARLATSVSHHPEVVNRLGHLVDMWRDKLADLWRRGQGLGAVRTDLPVGVFITMTLGLRQAAASTKLPAERTASDGELAAFDQFYSGVLERMFDLSRPSSEG